MFIRKLTNTSDSAVGIKMADGNVVHVNPKGILENFTPVDLSGIAGLVKVEYDLTEVTPVSERKALFD